MTSDERSREELLAEIEELRNRLKKTEADIAERTRAEEELRQSHDRLARVLEIETVGVMYWDLNTGCMTNANETFLNTMGYSRRDLETCELTWQKLTPPEYMALSEAEVRKFMTTGRVGPYEKEYFRKDGTRQWFVFAGSSIGNNACVEFCVDISDRKKAEAALKASEASLQLALHSANAGTWVWDMHTNESVWSEEIWTLFGLEPHSCASSYDVWLSSVHPEDRDNVERGVKEAVATGTELNLEWRVRKREGETSQRWLFSRGQPKREADGRVASYLGIVLDITARKEAENNLKALNATLEQRVAERTAELREKDQILLVQARQAAMGEMISSIAHQWRQPLNVLGLKIQQMKYNLESDGCAAQEEVTVGVDGAMEVIQHMSKTIDEFRSFFESKGEKSSFNVHEVTLNILSLLDARLKDKHIFAEAEAKGDVIIHGYKNEFAQALLNILNNAVDALLEREVAAPRLHILIEHERSKPVVTISDNAGGIPDEFLDKIFEPYFSTKKARQGTGIGLYMSKLIIEKNMGGRLSVRNNAEGAEFRIAL